MAVHHHHFLSKYNEEREGKSLPSEIQARGEVVLFKLARKRLILWRKMEETCGEGRETNFLVLFDEREK